MRFRAWGVRFCVPVRDMLPPLFPKGSVWEFCASPAFAKIAGSVESNKRGKRQERKRERERQTSLQILSIAVCLSDARLSDRKRALRATGWSAFCIVTLFLYARLASLSFSFPREFDHLANPVVARQARQTEAFRAIPDGAFIFPPPLPSSCPTFCSSSLSRSPSPFLLSLPVFFFPNLFFFLLLLVPTKYIDCLAVRTLRRVAKRAAVCQAICENYTISKAILSNYNILWRLRRVWKMVSSLAFSYGCGAPNRFIQRGPLIIRYVFLFAYLTTSFGNVSVSSYALISRKFLAWKRNAALHTKRSVSFIITYTLSK